MEDLGISHALTIISLQAILNLFTDRDENMKTCMTLLMYLCLFLPKITYATELTVSAATSLTNVMLELKDNFEKTHPSVKIYTNFASSSTLLKQIQMGAKVDVFASADMWTMEQGIASNVIKAHSRRIFASNSLALIIPQNATIIPTNATDLLDKFYTRIAIGNVRTVPVGRYAQGALIKQNLWKLLENRFVYGEHVHQVLEYVVRGEVPAGFVYGTDAYRAKGKVKIAFSIETKEKIQYPIGMVASSENKKVAQEFIDYVSSDKARIILEKYGFSNP